MAALSSESFPSPNASCDAMASWNAVTRWTSLSPAYVRMDSKMAERGLSNSRDFKTRW